MGWNFFFSLILIITLKNNSSQIIAEDEQMKLSLGTNLNIIADWSTEIPFLDAFKSSRKWMTQCKKGEPGCTGFWQTNEYEKLNLDEYGWVKSLPAPEEEPGYTQVGTLMFRGIDGNYPGGKYLVLYEGEGTIEYGYDAKKDNIASSPGRDVINVTPSNAGIYLAITSTDPNKTGNYIRNINVIKAEEETTYAAEIFNPVFLEKIRKFSTVRFMDWMKTNNSEQKEWENRPKIETVSYADQGSPIEIMVELANRLEVEPWFTMPHQATDEYIKNFAQMVKESLKYNLNVYIEYSNEVWNPQFEQAKWVEEQGKTEWKQNRKNGYKARLNWHGKRTVEMCEIWKEVFEEEKNRIICVLGAQAANSWTVTEALDCPLWEKKPCYKHGIDAVAIAPYFGGYIGSKKHESQVENWTVEQLFQEINQGGVLIDGLSGGAIKQAVENMKKNLTIARKRKLQLIAYEGGQHLAGKQGVENNQTITDLFITANRDPQMYNVYKNYLNQWKNLGGGLFMHYSDIGKPSKWGSWGALENVYQQSSPKYDALMDFIEFINSEEKITLPEEWLEK